MFIKDFIFPNLHNEFLNFKSTNLSLNPIFQIKS